MAAMIDARGILHALFSNPLVRLRASVCSPECSLRSRLCGLAFSVAQSCVQVNETAMWNTR